MSGLLEDVADAGTDSGGTGSGVVAEGVGVEVIVGLGERREDTERPARGEGAASSDERREAIVGDPRAGVLGEAEEGGICDELSDSGLSSEKRVLLMCFCCYLLLW